MSVVASELGSTSTLYGLMSVWMMPALSRCSNVTMSCRRMVMPHMFMLAGFANVLIHLLSVSPWCFM